MTSHRSTASKAFVALVAVAGYLIGAAAMEYKTFPHAVAQQFFMGLRVLQYFLLEQESELWKLARGADGGVTRYDPEKAFDGVTLYTSADAHEAYLIDMDGTVLHRWSRRYSEVWDETADTADPFDDDWVYMRNLYLYPNGDLLVVYGASNDTPWGYGLVKLDKDSNVVWKYLRNVHHEATVGPDGRIYALGQSVRTTPVAGLPDVAPPMIDETIAILDPDGRELKVISVLEAIAGSGFEGLLDKAPISNVGDYTHVNAVDVVDAAYAARVPLAEEGQLLVSLRNLDTIVLIDVEEETVTWAFRGPWRRQHDPDLLPDGAMLIFDNLGGVGPGGASRVIEFDPASHAVRWIYAGSADEPFESDKRASQQRLPNGNTLITESHGARLFEVTRDKQIVWEFRNPSRNPDDPRLVAIVNGGRRFARDDLPFLAADE